MAEEAYPPSPAFTGIDFNPSFFPSTANDYLEFPVAQGTETFGTIYTTKIDTPTPSTDFDLLGSETGNITMGALVATGKSLTLGSSASSTTLNGTNVTVPTKLTTPAIYSTTDATNMFLGQNLTSGNLTIGGSVGHTGSINIGSAQTTGALNIGNGSRTGNGAINIGNQATGTIAITIGSTAYTNIALRGPTVDVSTKLTSPTVDSTSDVTAMTVASNLTTANLTIAGAQTQGVLNIGTGPRITGGGGGGINIGTGAVVGTGGLVPIIIGTASYSSTDMYGTSVNVRTKITCPQIDSFNPATSITYGSNLVGGSLTIGGTGQTGGINIGSTSTTSNIITVGSSTTSSVLNGTSVKATTKLITPILDCVADTGAGVTALSIGPSVILGDIEIGNAQTTGDIKIGQSDISGATITIGKSATATTINGTLTTTNGVIAGRVGAFAVDTLSLGSASITLLPASVNTIANMYFYGGAVPAFPYIIGTGFSVGQLLTLKNNSSSTVTIQFTDSIMLNNATTATSSTTLLSGQTLQAYYVNNWMQTNATTSASLSTSVLTPLVTTASAGTLSLGTATATGVTIGASTIPTTINGTLTCTGVGILGGGTSYIQNDVASLSLTGTYNYMLFIKCGVTAVQTVTLPVSPPTNQYISFRCIKGAGGTVSVAGNGKQIYANNGITSASSVTLNNSQSFKIFYDGVEWVEY